MDKNDAKNTLRIVLKDGRKIAPGQKVVIKAIGRNGLLEKTEKKLGSGVVLNVGDEIVIASRTLGKIKSQRGFKRIIGSNNYSYRAKKIAGVSPDAVLKIQAIDE